GDGTLELVLKQGIPIWYEYLAGLPWRTETRTCAWDGNEFKLKDFEITQSPFYRFQALQDADRAALAGEYEKARNLYQQVIYNDKLQWWTEQRHLYEYHVYNENMSAFQGMAPHFAPSPRMHPDPDEYPSLAAYAYFRLMVLNTVHHKPAEAQMAYNSL